MASNVQMVFRGEVLAGFQTDDVRRALAQALQLDESRAVQLFSGARTVLKRSVEPALALRYVEKLARLGARVDLEPSDAPPTTGFAPLPELPEVPVSAEPPTPPWGTPPPQRQVSRPMPLVQASAPAAASAPVPLSLTQPAPLSLTQPAPLALQELSTEQVTCPNCGERQSRRLLCRNCTTDIEMALAAKQEALDQARAARLAGSAPRNSGFGRPAARAAVLSDAPGLLGLGFEGRMGRMAFATAAFASTALFYMPLIMVLQKPTLGRIALLAIAAIALTFFSLRATILRCHDCDKSGWWSLLLWVPTVNFVQTLLLCLVPGTDGSNDYGEQPAPSSGWGLGAAIAGFALLLLLTFSNLMRIIERDAEDRDDDSLVQFQADPRAASLPTLEAQAAFNDSYLRATHHKAFAVSPSSGWGFVSARSSQSEAVRGALLECEARRAAYTAPCVPVNVDGQWAQNR